MITVAVGILRDDEGRVLVTRRAASAHQGGLWEFPGGKLEAGETREEALIRELKEELRIDVDPFEFVITIDHSYPDFRLIMHSFKCRILSDKEPELTEHLQSKWLIPSDLDVLDWAAADVPIVEVLK